MDVREAISKIRTALVGLQESGRQKDEKARKR